MKHLIVAAAAACIAIACSQQKGTSPPVAAEPAALGSGIELQDIDDSIRLQDDFYGHVNGKWLATFQIPADKVSYDPWDKLVDNAREQARDIIEGLQKHADPADSDQQKIADLYASFMDE
ncbi:MAG: hypothetical protein ACRETU_00320, partial [Steroidobacterales bacterium]